MAKNRIRDKRYTRKQIGVIIILAPLLLTAIMAISALVVDLGMMRIAGNELQTTLDSASLAAANALPNGNSAAITAADVMLGSAQIIGGLTISNPQVELGTWDSNTSQFTATTKGATAALVSGSVKPQLFFYNLFSKKPYTVSKSSTASLLGNQGDIVFVVDLSPDMSEYSQLSGYGLVSLSTITTDLLDIYDALGLPTLGNMTWTPRLINGSTTSIINTLGLTQVAYPYPAGSWTGYVNYVKTDPSLLATGYANEYGYLTFVNYLEADEPTDTETPTLWETPEQPLATAKQDIDYFIANNMSPNDELALVTYNAADGVSAVTEQHLTTDFSLVSAIMDGDPATNTPGRQAANYSSGDIMDTGIAAAIEELNRNGQPNTPWIIYIFTGSQLAVLNLDSVLILFEAELAANQHITINIIDVGPDVDTGLLQLVAQITGGTLTQAPPGTDFGDTLSLVSSLTGTAQIVK